MDREKSIYFRNLFLRMFVIGIVFAILLFVATLAFWKTGAGWVMQLFKIDEKELGRIVPDVLHKRAHRRSVLLPYASTCIPLDGEEAMIPFCSGGLRPSHL